MQGYKWPISSNLIKDIIKIQRKLKLFSLLLIKKNKDNNNKKMLYLLWKRSISLSFIYDCAAKPESHSGQPGKRWKWWEGCSLHSVICAVWTSEIYSVLGNKFERCCSVDFVTFGKGDDHKISPVSSLCAKLNTSWLWLRIYHTDMTVA